MSGGRTSGGGISQTYNSRDRIKSEESVGSIERTWGESLNEKRTRSESCSRKPFQSTLQRPELASYLASPLCYQAACA